MTLEELYDQIGGDYDEAVGRMRMEKLVDRFIVKFLEDTSCADLLSSWEAGDDEATFNAAHTAKGLCANLAITSIAEPANEITEALRPGNDALRASVDVDALVSQLGDAYRTAVERINAYIAERD